MKTTRLHWLCAAALATLLSHAAVGDPVRQYKVEVAPQRVQQALKDFARQTSLQIVYYTEVAAGISSPGATGTLSADDALKKILAGTGLDFVFVNDRTVSIRPAGTAATPQKSSRTTNAVNSLALAQAAGMQRAEASVQGVQKETSADGSQSTEVVVTGSTIKRHPGELDRQVTIYTRKDIEASGATTLEEFVRYIPQNFNAPTENAAGFAGNFGTTRNYFGAAGINLRGVGERATLVLIDGKRTARGGVLAEATDITTIPLSMIERIDIIFDGASSLYGADAVGGVVNIITRKDYQGIEVGLTQVQPELSGARETTARAGGTYAWSTGSLTASYQYMYRESLDGSQRDLRFVRGNAFNLTGGSPANIRATAISNYNGPVTLPLYYIDAAGNAFDTAASGRTPVLTTQLPEGLISIGPIPASSFTGRVPTAGAPLETGYGLIPGRDDHALSLRFRQDLPGRMLLSGGVSFTPTKTSSESGNKNLVIPVAGRQGPQVAPGVFLAGNPNSPFLGNVEVYALAPYLPDTVRNTEKSGVDASLNLDGYFSDDWEWGVSASSSMMDSDGLYENVLLANGSLTAVGVIGNPVRFRAAPFNLNLPATVSAFLPYFGFASAEEAQSFLIVPAQRTESKNTDQSLELNTQGTLARFSSGAIRAGGGVGIREEHTELYDESKTVSSPFLGGQQTGYNTDTLRRNTFARGEINVPVLGSNRTLKWARRLELTASGHYDRYESFGSAGTLTFGPTGPTITGLESTTRVDDGISWSIGGVWSPTDWVSFRVNRNRAFSMPAVNTYALPTTRQQSTFQTWLPPNYTVRDQTLNVIYLGGGNPDLQAETSISTAFGITLTPRGLPDFMVRVNVHENDYTNKVGGLNLPQTLSAADFASGQVAAISVDPITGLYMVDERLYNNGASLTRGVDAEFVYSTDTELGRFDARLDYGYMMDSVIMNSNPRARAAPIVPVSLIGEVSLENRLAGRAIPRHRVQLRFGWQRGGLSTNVSMSTASNTTNWTTIVNPANNTTVLGTSTTQPARLVNLSMMYDFDDAPRPVHGLLKRTRIGLSVPNIFMKEANFTTNPTFNAPQVGNYDPIYTEPRGRTFTLSLTKRFE